MSNVDSPNASAADAGSPATTILRIVLFLILGLLVVAFFVDQRAQQDNDRAYEEVLNLGAASEFATSMPTREDVEKKVGFPPAGPPVAFGDKDDKMVEVYHWRRGLPFLSYTLHVIYSKRGDDKLDLSTASQNGLPNENDPDEPAIPTVTPSTGDTPPTPPGSGDPMGGPMNPRPGTTDMPPVEGPPETDPAPPKEGDSTPPAEGEKPAEAPDTDET